MNSPLISIIIPTFNRAKIIGETLDSIILQTYSNWECIVIDDGSTDNTSEVLQKYIDKDTRFQYHQRPKNKLKGPNSCRNYGFKLCKGEFINFFDSDDLYSPKAFTKIVPFFLEKVDAVIAKTKVIDFETGEPLSENTIFSQNMIEDYFVGNITFFVGGGFWKKSFLDKQNYIFDENIGNIDDWDFNLRMLYCIPELFFLDEPLMKYRIHKNSFSKELGKLNKTEIISDFKARDKHLHLIKSNKRINKKNIQNFILKRYSRYLKVALHRNMPIKYFLFKILIKKQIKFNNFFPAIKTLTGFVLYLVFKKGYRLLKD